MESGVGNADGARESRHSASGSGLATPESSLAIRLLGPIEVRLGGEPLTLPRSRKCRALIAYLAAAERPRRRDHLCETLWEVPDDPRGALRWSLSKIRRILGEALVADRESVSIDRSTVGVDSLRLIEAAASLDSVATPDLETLAGDCADAFGLDLDLPRCPSFQAWVVAVREDVRRARLAVLRELIRRLSDEPDRALPFARARVACDPLDEQSRLDLLAILAAAGRADEAESQRRIAVELFEEAGFPVPAGLSRPIRGAGAAAEPAEPVEPAERLAPVAQRIQFCTAPDGTRIAYSVAGSGPPLVKTANWMSHLEHEWESPLLRHWLVELSSDRSLVRYDARGNGLSDRRAADLSLEAFVQDLETVTATLAEESFDLLGISQGCGTAIAFAARHPAKVRRLVLFGGFASGWQHSRDPDVKAQWEAMITLAGLGWGNDNPAFRQLFTSLFAPRATPEQAGWFNDLQRASASPEEAQRLLRAIGAFDVRPVLGAVAAPTLVLHCRGDSMVPIEAGRFLASSIKGAEFVGLDSDNHLPLEDEPAWPVLVRHLRDFLSR